MRGLIRWWSYHASSFVMVRIVYVGGPRCLILFGFSGKDIADVMSEDRWAHTEHAQFYQSSEQRRTAVNVHKVSRPSCWAHF